MVTIPHLKMVMTGGWFMALFYPHHFFLCVHYLKEKAIWWSMIMQKGDVKMNSHSCIFFYHLYQGLLDATPVGSDGFSGRNGKLRYPRWDRLSARMLLWFSFGIWSGTCNANDWREMPQAGRFMFSSLAGKWAGPKICELADTPTT